MGLRVRVRARVRDWRWVEVWSRGRGWGNRGGQWGEVIGRDIVRWRVRECPSTRSAWLMWSSGPRSNGCAGVSWSIVQCSW